MAVAALALGVELADVGSKAVVLEVAVPIVVVVVAYDTFRLIQADKSSALSWRKPLHLVELVGASWQMITSSGLTRRWTVPKSVPNPQGQRPASGQVGTHEEV